MPRWSKLQKRLYDLIAPGLPFQIHCVPYRMKSQRGSMDIPRYWITLDKEIIWDYPRDFDADRRFGRAALRSLLASTSSEPARKILLRRLGPS